jgi:hypothetical protein
MGAANKERRRRPGGSQTAARAYRKATAEFLKEHGKNIPALAEDAQKALDTSEGDALRRAEREGSSHAKK